MTIRKLLLSTMALAVLAGPAITVAHAQDVPPPPSPNGAPAGHGGPNGAMGGPGGHGPMGMMENADTDGDGLLSKAEFMTAHEKRFEEIDTDKDGKLSKDEMKNHRDAMRAKYDANRKEWESKKKSEGDKAPAATPAK